MAITMDGIFVNGQKVTFTPENILSGDASAYTEEIGTAVEAWMEENVTGGEQVTDTTLTLPGVPADANKTGDEIGALKEDLNDNRELLYSELDVPIDVSSGGANTETLNEGYYNTDGEFVENNTRGVTDLIEISSLEHLYYTGRYNGKVATFWDSNREYISQALNPYDGNWTNRDIMGSASSFPANAVYITLQTKLLSAYNPPSIEPVIISVTASTGGFLYESITGDGITDDSAAIQNLVNTRSIVRIPRGMKIRLDSAVTIPNTCQLFDGGNSEFLAYGACAFVVTGELTGSMSANPNTLDQAIIDDAGRIIQNCKIKGGTGAEDGIQASGCFKQVFSNLYIHNVTNGIKFTGRNRDTTVINCSVYACAECGILLGPNVNFHQCNLVNLFVSYCRKCIAIDSPQAIANVQINGCDIEISSYPDTGKDTARCIYITCGSSSSSDQLSEMEISGCTIQGHNLSDGLVEIVGTPTRKIRNISICGNHMSNTSGGNPAIILSDCDNISISGNTIAEVYQILAMANCTYISLVGNSAGANERGARGLAEIGGANSGLMISGNTISGLSGKGITLLTDATVTDSCVVGNIIKATGGTIGISTTDRNVVANNVL